MDERDAGSRDVGFPCYHRSCRGNAVGRPHHGSPSPRPTTEKSGAVEVAKRALEVAKEIFGPEHPNVAVSLNNLATLRRMQGNYTEAEPLYNQALMIKEQNLGSDHPKVATSLNNLGRFYRPQGKYDEVVLLYERAQRIRENP